MILNFELKRSFIARFDILVLTFINFLLSNIFETYFCIYTFQIF